MESIIAASEDALLPILDYKLERTASYIESRQEVTSFSSVPIASPNGVKVLPFNITSEALINPHSVFFGFNINNKDGTTPTAKSLKPLTTGPHGFIQRMIISVNGQPVEDINYYGGLNIQGGLEQRLNSAANA